ncbi:MAG: hypothetical protein JO023_17045 [Chloroflexi bacterium]|nr:hypothetical protein [Chloroflexota bacterium]
MTIADVDPAALRLDQHVYDRESTRVGTVDAFDPGSGWMMVGTNPFTERAPYIPFRLITSVDPRELYLSATRSEVERDYRQPPPRTTTVRGEGKRAVATTIEPSGYDGGLLVIKRTRLDLVAHRITEGDHVLTADATDIGWVTSYDRVGGTMGVERGLLFKHALLVPIAVVDHVERAQAEVHLVVREADLRRRTEPGTGLIALTDG